mgnify:CR=1 FL=1
MLLYHGTTDEYLDSLVCKTNGIDIKNSKPFLDFGPGFYTNLSKPNAAKYAKRQAQKHNTRYPDAIVNACLLTYEFDEVALKKYDGILYRCFDSPAEEWKAFVLANRIQVDMYRPAENNLDARYGIVRGPIADGQRSIISNYAFNISRGLLRIEDVAVTDLIPAAPYHCEYQVSFHENSIANSFLSLIDCDIISVERGRTH